MPTGFTVSTTDGEDSISKGLVITDGVNEFVWIPVNKEFVKTSVSGDYSEPTELINSTDSTSEYVYDTQDELNYYYGQKEDGTNYYNYNVDFDYTSHYNEMVESVNKYNGFYIGRYETTIDDNGNIGSKENTTILTADLKLKEGTNSTSGKPYYYRWWGLYDSQRNSNVVGNGENIQTNMIWGQQHSAMVSFLGTTQSNSTIAGDQSQKNKSESFKGRTLVQK